MKTGLTLGVVSPFWRCRGRTSEYGRDHGSRDEGSRTGPAATDRYREPTPALCSGNTGSGLGWLCTTYGSSPAMKRKWESWDQKNLFKGHKLRSHCEIIFIIRAPRLGAGPTFHPPRQWWAQTTASLQKTCLCPILRGCELEEAYFLRRSRVSQTLSLSCFLIFSRTV